MRSKLPFEFRLSKIWQPNLKYIYIYIYIYMYINSGLHGCWKTPHALVGHWCNEKQTSFRIQTFKNLAAKFEIYIYIYIYIHVYQQWFTWMLKDTACSSGTLMQWEANFLSNSDFQKFGSQIWNIYIYIYIYTCISTVVYMDVERHRML